MGQGRVGKQCPGPQVSAINNNVGVSEIFISDDCPQDDLAPDPDWLSPPGPLLQQHADPGQEDLRQHGPAGLHQG